MKFDLTLLNPSADVIDFEGSKLSKLNTKSGRKHAEVRLIGREGLFLGRRDFE